MRSAILVAIILSGCGSPTRVVVMQHPETKQVVECRIDPWGHINRYKQIDDCKSAYEQAGFRVVGDKS